MGANTKGWNPMALEGWLTEVQSISGLLGVSIEDWVVLLKNKFDVHAHNEPHIAQALFLEKASGRFLHKVFGKTIRDGRLDAPSGLPELAQDIFEHSRVCQGFDSDLKGEHWNSLAPGFHPYPRQMDPGCSFVFKDPSNTATVCPSCTQTMHCEVDQVLVEEVFEAVDHKPDIEPEEIIVTMEDLTKIDLNEVEASLWPSDDKLGGVTFSDSDKVAKDDKQDEKPIIKDGTPGLKRKRRTIKSASKSDVVETCAPNEPIQKESLNVKSGDKLPLFPCNHCNKMFRGRGGYRKHRAFLRNRSRKIPCKVCADVHYSFDSLAKHMEVEHLQVPISLTQYLQPPEEIKTMRNGQRCSTCKVYCNGLSVLTRHRALYHELGDFKCADCHQYHLTYYDLVLHNYNQHDKLAALLKPSTEDLDKVEHEDGRIELKITRYDCPKCDKSYNDDGIWGIHMKAHHSWSIFTCQECDEKCHYVKDFVDHVKNFHSDNPEIKCPKCAEIISLGKEDLKVFETHLRACIKPSNPMLTTKKVHNFNSQCERCGKKFQSWSHLKCHLDSHDGVHRYKCDKCDYATNLKFLMTGHLKCHLRAEGKTQDASGNNLFIYCDRCPRKFTDTMVLRRHVRQVHEGIKRLQKCPDCDLTFYASSKLYTHRKSAHGFVSKKRKRIY